jgi:HD superfamily phosphohydrolase
LDYQTIAKILGVLGPVTAAIGAALLTYDALRGPVRWYDQIYFHRARLRTDTRIHESLLKSLSSLPSPPYSEEEKKQLMNEQIEKHKMRVLAEEDQTADKDLEERFYSQKLALWGFGLVAVGS